VDFGSYNRLKALIAKTSKGVDGNGWGILGYQPYTQKLAVLQCENHEKHTQWGDSNSKSLMCGNILII
jgi:Fe-Mn family superoxide dismutase